MGIMVQRKCPKFRTWDFSEPRSQIWNKSPTFFNLLYSRTGTLIEEYLYTLIIKMTGYPWNKLRRTMSSSCDTESVMKHLSTSKFTAQLRIRAIFNWFTQSERHLSPNRKCGNYQLYLIIRYSNSVDKWPATRACTFRKKWPSYPWCS